MPKGRRPGRISVKLAITQPPDGATIEGPALVVTGTASSTTGTRGSKGPVPTVTVVIQEGATPKKTYQRKDPDWAVDHTITSYGTEVVITALAEAKLDAGPSDKETVKRTVRVREVEKPVLKVTNYSTEASNTLTWKEGGVAVEIKGTASPDPVSGVKSVTWSLDGAPPKLARSESSSWSEWSVSVRLPEPGKHIVRVEATDRHDNRSPKATIAFNVAREVKLQGIDLASYLKDLIDFAKLRVKGLTSEQDLEQLFCQPFSELIQSPPSPAAIEPVHQVRICIEVCRRFLGNYDSAPHYCRDAYQLLLRKLGTSYEEIRIARVDGQTKGALADRLGVEPSGLEKLFLKPEEVDEAKLEALFGLADTRLRDERTEPRRHRPELPQAVRAKPEFLALQEERLRAQWREHDGQAGWSGDPDIPIIDPDLLEKADFTGRSIPFQLWNSRKEWVDVRLNQIVNARKGQSGDLPAFDAVVGLVLENIDLEKLADERGHRDIKPELKEHGLDLRSFLRLVAIRKLAESGTVLPEEWQDVDAILLQAAKRREYRAWCRQEEQRWLVLDPQHFTLGGSSGGELPRSRADSHMRRQWRNTLASRIDQQRGLAERLKAAVENTEEQMLPVLRDSLLGASRDGAAIDADWLTKRLFISFKYGGGQRTTHLEQSIETLQDILFSLRTGSFAAGQNESGALTPSQIQHQLPPPPLPKWELDHKKASTGDPKDDYTESKFDDEWTSMGSYMSWRAAMLAFHYPENYLLPTLRERSSKAFKNEDPPYGFVERLRAERSLTPSRARTLADEFLKLLREDDKSFLRHELDKSDDRDLYQALRITDELRPGELDARREICEKLLSSRITKGKMKPDIPSCLAEIFYFVPIQLALALHRERQYLAAIDWFQIVYAFHLSKERRKIYYYLEAEKDISTVLRRRNTWMLDGLNPHHIATDRANAYTRFTLLSLIRCFLDFADAEFTREIPESIARARQLYLTALDLLGEPELKVEGSSPFPNPVLQALTLRAEANLEKLRTGRNIAGMPRAAGTTISTEGLSSTHYRYSSLIGRAKELVGLAQQTEGAYLAALEKRDAAAYNVLRARQDSELAKATVQMQDLRVAESDHGIALAGLQKERAEVQRDTYGEWLEEDLNHYERGLLSDFVDLRRHKNLIAGLEASLAVANAGAAALGPGGGFGIAAIGAAVSYAEHEKLTKKLNQIESSIQINQFYASHERRRDEWHLQKSLAEKDIQIGEEQIALATAQKEVVEKERKIAELRVEHTVAAVEFLDNQFTNVDLYEWMSGVLGEVYGYFLQQATAMAQLAQSQLAFERQEKPVAVIQGDYWEPPEASTSSDEKTEDRRGLTGSTRLLRDIHRLELHAFETNRRKLQLRQSFSLARLMPYDFQRFRETGVLPFATPLKLFDQGFPGHYLRLVKRVSVSVVALVPPTQGIRATLAASGISRVVTGGDGFPMVEIQRQPELIAFTSPSGATGVFELQPDDGMLLPFEGMGVDTSWELQMPPAANAFDYRSLYDVLLTIDYTALDSPAYRERVVRELDRSVSAEKELSIRDDFVDAWYHVHNAPDDRELVVNFETTEEDFPRNVDELRIQHVVLYFAKSKGNAGAVEVRHLRLVYLEGEKERTVTCGEATAADGLISTRDNASNWTGLKDKPPIGKWELALSESARTLFDGNDGEQLDDILFVLTYGGRTPAWPS